ncbi:MAG: glycoside hydrolase family 31 [Actinobacteria bacterium HGW-Actinobacteria-4]|nr:MAG: glycoside hydrolase family 31 [Actinobacteria bacterium HGW-Actinobacteria-4]
MLRLQHRPLGSGHGYQDDSDQRSPVVPEAGSTLRLGARANGETTDVHVAVVHEFADGHTTALTLPCLRTRRTERGQAVDGGHLAAAQARADRDATAWEATFDVDPDAVAITYAFHARSIAGRTKSTKTFRADVARWTARDDSLVGAPESSVVPGSVSVLVAGERIRRVRFALPLLPGESVVGFGERFDQLDQRGERLDSQVFEQYKNQGATKRTYLPMPFAHVVGGAGWGFHVETTRRVWFDVGASDPTRLWIDVDVDEPADAATVASVAIYRGSPTLVLDAFLNDVGRATELPTWVLRLWASGNEWNTQEAVEREMALHRQHDIPVGSVVIEAWSDESTFTVFRDAEFTPNQAGEPLRGADITYPADGAWPDPQSMIDSLHEHGVKVILWQIPLMKMRPHPRGQARYDADAAVQADVVVKQRTSDGSTRPYRNRGWWFPLSLMPDLTDARAAQWWVAKRRYLVEDLGIDGFKTDGGEHAWGSDLQYLDGSTGADKNNVFPVAYAKAYGDLLRSCGKAPVTFSRSGFTGSQAHGAFWAGDENSTWDAFRWSMWAGLSASACGIVYWGWDIAGFSGPVPEPELYVRAFAASAFVPIMQYHSEFNHHKKPRRDRTPWHVAQIHGDDAVIGDVRSIVHLRERLLPYLEEQARKAVNTSAPLMRALFFDYPDDPKVWTSDPQWLLGDDILVAPIVTSAGTRDVYVPEGRWRDAWTGEAIKGGVTVARECPRHQVPVYVREEAWDALAHVFGAVS